MIRDEVFYNTDPAVEDAALGHRNRNPCGYFPSIPLAVAVDQARLSEVTIPVLLVYADHDVAITREGADQQEGHYTGTDDVNTVHMENTGHFPMLDRTVPTLHAVMYNWLCERDLVAIPCKLSSEDGAVEGGGGRLLSGLP